MIASRAAQFLSCALLGAVLSVPTTASASPGAPDGGDPSTWVSGGSVSKASASGGASTQVTLITGDVVTVTPTSDGRHTVTVDRAPGNDGLIRTQTVGHDLYVWPEAALPYAASGVLDHDLFNVSELIRDGYDDASTPNLPLIVEYKPAAAKAINKRGIGGVALPAAAVATTALSSIGGAAMGAQKDKAPAFWASVTSTKVSPTRASFGRGIEAIYLDGKVEATLSDSVAQIGAPQAWAAGYDGTGVTVAVLDTGVDTEHPDLAPQITDTKTFVPDENIDDYNGHGTHVASTVAGTGAASGGVEKGVAPGADLVIGKVLGDDGFGQESWIIDGMEWAATHADVINMSLGDSEPSDGSNPMDQAVDTLTAQTGALFVIAAGNAGAPGAIGAPGAADAALTVGAVDADDQLAWFSSMGPRLGNSAMKPDLTAPGVGILAARSQYSPGEGSYVTMDGTSMATPHVTGAAAILVGEHPNWGPKRLKNALMSTAVDLPGYTPYQVGTGRVDVAAAIGDVHATGSRFFGFLKWPNDGLDPIERTITYTNDGDDAVTLDLAASFSDADGNAAPDGTLSLDKTEVTVPAHGKANVVATVDPDLAPAGSRFGGAVVASLASTEVVRTAIAIDKEAEKYPLTLRMTGRDGQPASGWVSLMEQNDLSTNWYFVDGELTLRMSAGIYSAMSFMDVSDGPDEAGMALVGDPDVKLNKARVVDLDASAAVPVTATIKRPNDASMSLMEYYVSRGVGLNEGALTPVLVDNMYAQPTEHVTDGRFEFSSRWRLREPLMSITSEGHRLDVIQQAGGGWLDGTTSTVGAVYLGEGKPADYNGHNVEGKAVVITRPSTASLYDRGLTAQRHHAKVLIVVNNAPSEFSDWAGSPGGAPLRIPVGGISGIEGATVIDSAQQPGAKVTVAGGRDTDWTFDLVDPHPGAIPDNLSYAPKLSDLAKIKTQYYGTRHLEGGEFRFSMRPYSQFGSGFMQIIDFPGVRTEWVSTAPGTRWVQNTYVIPGSWDVRAPVVKYQPGDNLVEKWFDPVVMPKLGPGYWPPERQGDFLQLNLPAFGDSGYLHTGGMDTAYTHQVMRLYDNDGNLLKESIGWQSLDAEVTPKLARYKLTSTASRQPGFWHTSTRVSSVYHFWTKHASLDEVAPHLPFLQLDFDVATNLQGDAPLGARRVLTLHAHHLSDAVGAGDIEGAKVWVSYDDGDTWKAATLTGGNRTWHTTLKLPDHGARFVSLRAKSWDDKGNDATQTVIRAFGLR